MLDLEQYAYIVWRTKMFGFNWSDFT